MKITRCLSILLALASPAIAQQSPIETLQAERSFETRSLDSRLTLQMLLTAAGYMVAVPTLDFSKRIQDAILKFQIDHEFTPTGYLSDEEEKQLVQDAWPFLKTWGFRNLPHPTRGHPIWIPIGLNLQAEPATGGIRWRDPDAKNTVIYSYKPNRSVDTAFHKAIESFKKNGATINYSIVRSDFYAISASGADGVDSYTRYHQDGDGILGFFLMWHREELDLHMERVAVLMSGSFGASMNGSPFVEPPSLNISQENTEVSPEIQPPALPPAKRAEAPSTHESSSGTGIFATATGDILTNAHVVSECSTISVTSSDHTSAPGNVIARDQTNDLALVRTKLNPPQFAVFKPSIRLGEGIAVYGYPLSNYLSSSGNFTVGNVTALAGLGDDSRYVQISAPVQPGNSGGPVLDQAGNVVGVVTSKLNALKIMSDTQGDIAQNVNFAIKSSVASNFLESNGIKFAATVADTPMQAPDLADRARLTAVFIRCL